MLWRAKKPPERFRFIRFSVRPLGGDFFCVFLAKCLVVVVDARGLRDGFLFVCGCTCDAAFALEALRTVFGEQDAKGGEDQLDVREDGHVVDVQKVKLQLFVGVGVVLAIDLGIAGEAGLDLEAEAEVREELVILLGDLRTLRAGADDAHVALKDVPELWQFVQAALANDAADGCDAVVLVPCREAGNAVLLRVDTHAAELVDFKFLSVLRQAYLLIDGGAAVVKVDGKGGDEHDGAEDDQSSTGGDNVKGALDDGVLRVQGAACDKEDRRVKGLDVSGLLHDDVTDMGQEEADFPLFLAILGDAVTAARMDPGDKDGVIILEFGPDGLEAVAVVLELFLDVIKTLTGLALDGAKALFVHGVAINEDGFFRGIELEVISVGGVRPGRVPEQLDHKEREEDPWCLPVVPGETDDEPHNAGTEELGKKLGKGHGPNPGIAEEVGVICSVEEKDADGVARRNVVVIAEGKFAHAKEGVITEEEPAKIEREYGNAKVQEFHAHDFDSLLVFRFGFQMFHDGYASSSFVFRRGSTWGSGH